jgi:hypothetical protein
MIQEKRLWHNSPLVFPFYTMSYSPGSQSVALASIVKAVRISEIEPVARGLVQISSAYHKHDNLRGLQEMVDVVNFFAILIFYFVIGFSLIGAALLCMGFQYAKVPGFDFFRCWKIYAAGLLYAYLIIWGIGMILPRPTDVNGGTESSIAPIMRTVLFYLIPMVAIPLLARDYSRRTIALELIVIVVANSIMMFLAYATLPSLVSTQAQTDRFAPAADMERPRSVPKRR